MCIDIEKVHYGSDPRLGNYMSNELKDLSSVSLSGIETVLGGFSEGQWKAVIDITRSFSGSIANQMSSLIEWTPEVEVSESEPNHVLRD